MRKKRKSYTNESQHVRSPRNENDCPPALDLESSEGVHVVDRS